MGTFSKFFLKIFKKISKNQNFQKKSVYIILGKEASNDYLCNLAILNLMPLDERRQQISEKFAKKLLKHPEHRKIFEFTTNKTTRAGRKVVVPKSKTTRYKKSAVPSLANIINEKLAHKI